MYGIWWLYQKLNVMTKVMMRWKWYFLRNMQKIDYLKINMVLDGKMRETRGDTGRLNKHWMLWVDMGVWSREIPCTDVKIVEPYEIEVRIC